MNDTFHCISPSCELTRCISFVCLPTVNPTLYLSHARLHMGLTRIVTWRPLGPQISSKDEDFFDLQVDVDQNTSISHCLLRFSESETLCGDNKFKCDVCCSYQEAQVRERGPIYV